LPYVGNFNFDIDEYSYINYSSLYQASARNNLNLNNKAIMFVLQIKLQSHEIVDLEPIVAASASNAI
jgi:hypothetical protein